MPKPTVKDLQRPDYLLALGFGSGLSPKAPGTAGSLLGLIIFLPALALPLLLQLSIIAVSLVAGIWICERVANDMAIKDPGAIVWDEFVGMWIAMLLLPSMLWAPLAFAVLRFFDIVKPWPVSLADRELTGGLGIMLDDVVAGVYALLVVQLIVYLATML